MLEDKNLEIHPQFLPFFSARCFHTLFNNHKLLISQEDRPQYPQI